MRGGVVGAGVLLMLLGAILFFVFPITANNSGANPFADLFLGPIFGVIGFLVFIVGLAASPNVPVQHHYYSQSSSPRSTAIDESSGYPDRRVIDRVTYRREDLVAPQPDPEPAYQARPTHVEDNPPTDPKASGDASAVYCPFCGAQTRTEFRFCRACGKEAPPA